MNANGGSAGTPHDQLTQQVLWANKSYTTPGTSSRDQSISNNLPTLPSDRRPAPQPTPEEGDGPPGAALRGAVGSSSDFGRVLAHREFHTIPIRLNSELSGDDLVGDMFPGRKCSGPTEDERGQVIQ